jgi:hypothetical protein
MPIGVSLDDLHLPEDASLELPVQLEKGTAAKLAGEVAGPRLVSSNGAVQVL